MLVLRRLRARVPVEAFEGPPAAGGPAGWQREARDSMADLARRAARPVQGVVPFDAEAVLFAEEAQLLACIARELARGSGVLPWWMAVPLRSFGWRGAPEVASVLGHDPRALPAVLAELDAWGAAVEVVARVPPSEAARLLQAVLAEHGVRRAAPSFEAIHAGRPASCDPGDSTPPERLDPAELDAPAPRPALPHAGRSEPRPGAEVGRAAEAPTEGPGVRATGAEAWPEAALPAEARRLHPAQRGLLGVALLLHREPERVRKAGVQPSHRMQGEPAPEHSAPPAPPSAVPRARAAPRSPSARDQDARSHAVRSTDRRTQPHADASPAAGTRDAEVAEPASSGPPSIHAPATGLAKAAGNPPSVHFTWPEPAPQSESGAPPEVAEPPALPGREEPVPTWCAGVLFLVHVVRRPGFLALLEDGGSPESGWSALELLGRALLALEGCARDDDALWPAMRALAGRDPSPALERRVAGAAPEVREELAAALADGPDTSVSLAETLLLRRGRLWIGSAHVDLVMDLEDVSLAVRRAGLDVDPGWVPELGRVVSFFYE